MKTLYWAVRVLGYAAGCVGMILFVWGRQQPVPRNLWSTTGAVLIIVSFAAFFASYFLYLIQRLGRR